MIVIFVLSVFGFILVELAEMGCEKGSSAQDISIPVVLIPKSGGQYLNKSIVDGEKGEHWFFTVLSFAITDSEEATILCAACSYKVDRK